MPLNELIHKKINLPLTISALLFFLFPWSVNSLAGDNNKPVINSSTQKFTLKLGATRVIYNPDSAGASILVQNEQDYPILVQSKVFSDDKVTAAPFVITPPLFRLEKEQQSRLRIIRTGGTFSEDKETLQWICVKGIPPKEGDAWLEDKDGNSPKPGNMANLKVQISISNCIKLFIRPSKLKGNSFDVASSVIWSKNNDKLEIKNPTPFYMNISSVMVDGSVVNGVEFVAPFSSRSFDLPNKSPKKVQWKIIGDHGGESMPFYSEL